MTTSTTVLSLYLKSSCQIKCLGIFEDPLNTFILGHHAQQVFLPLMHSLTCEREKVPQAHISSYGYVKTPLHPTQVICPFDYHLPHGEKTRQHQIPFAWGSPCLDVQVMQGSTTHWLLAATFLSSTRLTGVGNPVMYPSRASCWPQANHFQCTLVTHSNTSKNNALPFILLWTWKWFNWASLANEMRF